MLFRSDPAGVEVNGNGVVGEHRFGPFGITDPGDSILAAEVAAVQTLLDQLDPRTTRVGVVTFGGDSSPFTADAETRVPLTTSYERVRRGLDEIIDERADAPPPTHVFVQSGCGGLAAAVYAPLWRHYGVSRPQLVIVEPHNAACLYASGVAGSYVEVGGDLDTVMAGLSCGEPSLLAWPLLVAGTHYFMRIDDDTALAPGLLP